MTFQPRNRLRTSAKMNRDRRPRDRFVTSVRDITAADRYMSATPCLDPSASSGGGNERRRPASLRVRELQTTVRRGGDAAAQR
ncbi:hypothetical protein A6409_14385 [Prescottella equi]|nr:hypothetical protein A6409_14385 [Prescottella equi]BCN44085.1 hypothetical protein RE9414_23650 [Prescottella equi]BCN78396.1 hypothetical protein RE0346_20560 [Prescottella equi]